MQDDLAVAYAGGEVEVGQDGEGGDAGGTDQVQQFEAGPDVQVVGESVPHEQPGVLSQRPCQQHALTLPVLRDVSPRVRKGDIVGLVGPNGSGESTLLRTVHRSLRPSGHRAVSDAVDRCRVRPGGRRARRAGWAPARTAH